MWLSTGLKFLTISAFSPLGMAILMGAFLLSCIIRTLLRNDFAQQLYVILAIAVVVYLVGVVVVVGGALTSNTGSGQDYFFLMIFSMFFGVPAGVGWLVGWPIAVLLQLAMFGRPGEAAGTQDR